MKLHSLRCARFSFGVTAALVLSSFGSTGCMSAMSNGGGPGGGSSSGSSSGSNGSSSGSGSGSSSGSSGGSSGSSSGSSGSSGSGSSSGSGTMILGGPVDCNDTSSSNGQLVAQFDSTELIANNGKSYFLQTNWWHTFANETEDYTGLNFTVNNPMNAADKAGDNNPMGFPSIFIGSYQGNTTSGSNLPIAVSAIQSVPTIYNTNNSTLATPTMNHNATYDVWFTANGTPLPAGAGGNSPGAGGAYLMVWMFKPTDRQPRGSASGHMGQTVDGVPGTWNVWLDPTTAQPPCVSYVASTPIDGLAFDLNDFIKDAVAKNYFVTSSMYLSIVFGGFEIWGNNDGLQLKQFCAAVH